MVPFIKKAHAANSHRCGLLWFAVAFTSPVDSDLLACVLTDTRASLSLRLRVCVCVRACVRARVCVRTCSIAFFVVARPTQNSVMLQAILIALSKKCVALCPGAAANPTDVRRRNIALPYLTPAVPCYALHVLCL